MLDLPDPFQNEFTCEAVGARLVQQQRHLRELDDAPAVVDGLQHGLVRPLVRVARAVREDAVLQDSHAQNGIVDGRGARLKVQQVLPSLPVPVNRVEEAPQVVFR